jgi:hypothetical protein
MWQNKYVGIPYKDNGRDLEGMDCWGLVRYVYNKEFNISLPSLAEDYSGEDRKRIEDLVAQYREGWEESTATPKSGDLVLFRMMGADSHVGVITEYPYFLHARETHSSAIERLDNTQWKNRVVGIFRYTEAARNNLVAIPSPLKTTRITDYIPEGATLHQVYETLHELYGLPGETPEKVVIIVNGRVVPQDQWDYVVQTGDTLEYRAVPGKNVVRIVAVVALAYFTMGAATSFGTLASFTAGTSFAAGTIGGFALSMGVMAAGQALINKIAPIRPPDISNPADPGSAKSQNLINAASNTATPYGTIPVVLGKIRMTPPVGATNYVEPLETEAYLRMLLVWGYGPLDIQDMRIGSTVIGDYEQVHKTLTGFSVAASELAAFNSIYGKDVQQLYKNVKLVGTEGTPVASPWQEVTFTQPATELQVSVHFPQGLRKIKSKGEGAGDIYPAPFIAEIQYALAGDNDWNTSLYRVGATNFTLPNSTVFFGFQEDGGSFATLTIDNLYQWHTVYATRGGNIFLASGTPTEVQYSEPSNQIKGYFSSGLGGWYVSEATKASKLSTMTRMAKLPFEAIPLYDVCVRNNSIVTTTKRTEIEHTTTVTNAGLVLSVNPGNVSVPNANYILLGDAGQKFYKQKDAFTYTEKIAVPKGTYKVRVRRLNSGAADLPDSEYATLHDGILYTATAFDSVKPVTDPKVGRFARTALRIKATDQLNGSVEGINALVTSICPDWNAATGTWIQRATNNPASLFRWVLQHPANARRISDAELATQLDLPQLQYWHAYCISKGFTFNAVLNNAKSILDVLRDICAAGRASPSLVDGKWTVVIDEPRTQVIQHFSTHNTWDFEAVKPLVKIPDAFKVVYTNEAANYVQDELYVYNTGKNATNAVLFEELQLPGVTNAAAAFKHARWHLAQLKLRPETYSINTDLEYLVCNRGDLVRVQHDVPSWGVGTARIKQYISENTLLLDNEVLLQSNITYVLRIRLTNGSSITVDLAPIEFTGYYSQVTLDSNISATEGAAGNLVLIGEVNSESQECLVISVEPNTNGTARLTLVDYNPDMYNIDTSTAYPIPAFNSNITQAPLSFVPIVTQTPTITEVVSDESALEQLGPGIFRTRIKVSYSDTVGQDALSGQVTHIELQWKYSDDANTTWPNQLLLPVNTDSVYVTGVEEGATYNLRVRYVRFDGVAGDWTTHTNHTVVGRMTPPSQVQGTGYELMPTGVRLKWLDNPEIDVLYYEVRDTNTGWGLDSNYLFKGGATSLIVAPAAAGTTKTWYIRAIDAANNYSAASAPITYITPSLPNVTSITANYSSSSLTEATVELRWDSPQVLFGLAYYELSYNGIVKEILSNSIILPANWLGDRAFTLKVVDLLGNVSSGYTATVTKLAPNPIVGYRAQVIDNNVLLYWSNGAKTSLPIAHVLIKRSPPGGTWETASVVGTKSGEFTSISELSGGEYIYWLAAVDTDARESVSVQLPVTVSQPPDFKFTAEYISQLTGTYSNAASYAGDLFLPVNTAETWQQHFTANAWATPSAQVAAGYPVFVQPGLATGYYEEVFDYGTILASSQITLNTIETDVVGSTNKVATIYISTDGVTYTSVGNFNAFATNFRFIKIRLDVTQVTPGSICKISDLRVRLDSKQKSEANYVTVPTTGQIVNFESEFIDVQSIILTPAGTTPVLSVYDFKDVVVTGTYTVAANVATINATAHGLIAGQKVRLYFTTGNGVSGLYIIQTVVNANSYTVTMVIANTSGNVTTYPNSMIIYSFTPTTGVAVESTTSYQIKGY